LSARKQGAVKIRKKERKMKEITVKISKGKHSYKDKESGQQKEMDYIQFEFPNGKTDKYLSNRFNYRI